MSHRQTVRDRLDDVSWEFFKALKENVDNLAEAHLDAWKFRYEDKDIDDVTTDLYMNHDLSIEENHIKDIIGTSLSPTERAWLQVLFNETVLDKLPQKVGQA